MKYSHLPGIDKPISRLVQGTVMCAPEKQDYVNELLDAVYATGINTFDTAHGYGSGKAERSLGAWINSRGLRDKVVILGKGCHHNQDRRRVTPHDISSDIADSLARLQTDYIDLYVLHRD
ncbi:MAG: aldo/keto reductase, partial [Anaerolineales bacterium]|nr:aldo/keto reductase [Anaerolineales bacterium]